MKRVGMFFVTSRGYLTHMRQYRMDLTSHEFSTQTFGLKFILHAPTAKINEIKKKVSIFHKDDFRPASAKSGSLDTPLYLYYSLLFSYISILFIL